MTETATIEEASSSTTIDVECDVSPRCHEGYFRTHDRTALFYRAWLPSPRASRALILLHRGHEHSGRFEDFVRALDLEDTAVFAWDARGHGRSPGERGYADSFATVVKDCDCFVRFVSRRYGIAAADTIVLGHSVGAVVAAAWVHDYGPPVRAMILATPALRVKLYVPFARRALALRETIRGSGAKPAFVTSYVRSSMLTHDPAEAKRYDEDPLISKNIAVNVLLDLADTSDRLVADAGAIDVPTMVLAAGRDWVVSNRASRRFFERLTSPMKRWHNYDGFGHAIFHERGRERPIADVRRFIVETFDAPPATPGATDYTRREYERLAAPRPALCPKRIGYAIQRAAMKTGGRLSAGIELGWRRGFDSGESLDHVYRNTPAGVTPLGRLVDRYYLNTIGWRGIRQRKVHLQKILRETIDTLRTAGEPVRIVDIASGPGRYLLEVLRRYPLGEISAELRDRSPAGLDSARAIAGDLGLLNVTFAEGDAFHTDTLGALRPRPNVAIASGLYELFPDNSPIERSLLGLSRAVRPGGYFIYTNQPWHPQVEMIARVLTNRDGQPWVMRRRTQAEIDGLVRAAGFEKVGMEIDRWGIFTVSVAKRIGM